MSAEPTYTEVMNGERFNADNTSRLIAKMTLELLTARNMIYYTEHKDQFVKVGDYAMCSECNQMKFIRYMYGGTKPLCKECCKEILN